MTENNITVLPSYSLLDPTGNITILAEMPSDPEQGNALPRIAKLLMEREPSAEQVGFLSPGDNESDITLTMAGGEFCGNATLSAAAVFLAERPDFSCSGDPKKNSSKSLSFTPSDSMLVTVRVSGADAPVPVEMRRVSESCYEGTVRMPDAQSVAEETLTLDGQAYKFPVVRFKGIAHIITEKPMEKAFAELAIVRWCEDLKTDALGIMQISKDALIPLVYVRTADTLYWESSCASGTTAAGVYLSRQKGCDVTATFREPAGVLKVTAKSSGELYLSGSVKILKLQ